MTFLAKRRVMLAAAPLITLLLLVALFARRPSDPLQAAAVIDPPFTSLTYGIQAFLWWDYHRAAIDLDQIRTMAFSHVKQMFSWKDIEPLPGHTNLSRADEILGEIERRGLKLVVRLGDAPDWAHPSLAGQVFHDGPPDPEWMQAWAAYCRAIASRYPGRVAAYQIWNEPNLSREWGGRQPDAAEYVALLGACSQAIRQVDPQAVLISAGLSPTGNCCDIAIPDDQYLQALYDAGFQQYVDVVGMHAPGYSSPRLSPDDAPQRFFSFRRVEDLRQIMIANGDAARQAAVLEFGWNTDTGGKNPDYAWYAVSEAEQARNMVEAYRYAADHWRPWVGLMSAIYMADAAWTEEDEEYWWGVNLPNGAVRPAYIELANMAKYCGDRIIPVRAPDSPEALGLVPVDPCD